MYVILFIYRDQSYARKLFCTRYCSIEMYHPRCGLLQVNKYDYTVNDMKVTLFDTPGLADGSGKEEEYLRKIKKTEDCPFDVFIFCTDMNSQRFRAEDIYTIKTLTKTFPQHLWEHALVALTFANEVHPRKNAGVTVIEYFNDRMLEFQKKIRDVILEAGVAEQVVTEIPFVATGDESEPSLPGIADWKTNFWLQTLLSLKMSAQMPFVLFNSDRMKSPSSSSSLTEKVEGEQGAPSIHIDEDSADVLVKTIHGFVDQSDKGIFSNILLFFKSFAFDWIMEAIKKTGHGVSFREDAKDKDEVAKDTD